MAALTPACGQQATARRPRFLAVLLVALGAACASACVPARDAYYRGLTQALQAGRFEAARNQLQQQGPKIYGSRDQLLAPLDRAMVALSAGDWDGCIAACEQAKVLMEQLFTQHVSQHAEAYVLGDDRLPFVGEPFERVSLHLVEAAAYLAKGNLAEARVEARAMQATLRRDAEVAAASKEAATSDRQGGYKQDAWAYFLLGLLEADDPANLAAADDAAMDLQRALDLYEQQDKDRFATPVPRALVAALAKVLQRQGAAAQAEALQDRYGVHRRAPNDAALHAEARGQVVVVHLAGEAPAKQEAAWQTFTGMQLVEVPYPYFGPPQVPAGHLRARLRAAGAAAATPGGAGGWHDAELAQNLGQVARSTLHDHMGAIHDRAIARAVAAVVTTDALLVGGAIQGGVAGGVMQLAGLGIGIGAAATAHADTRSWRTLPDRVELLVMQAPVGPAALELEVQAHGGGRAGLPSRVLQVVVAAGQTTFLVVRSL